MAHFGVQKAKMVALAGVAALAVSAINSSNIFAEPEVNPYQATVDNFADLKTELARTPLTAEQLQERAESGEFLHSAGNVIKYSGRTLKLEEDLDLNGHTLMFENNVDSSSEQSINFSGHTLTISCGDYLSYHAIEVKSSNLDLYTDQNAGGINKTSCDKSNANDIHKEGSGVLTVNGGYYTSQGNLLYNHSGAHDNGEGNGIVINGGTFNVNNNPAASEPRNALIFSIWFDSNTKINGGKFNLNNASLYHSVATASISSADYVLTINGGTFDVLSDTPTGVLINTGGNAGATGVIIHDGTFNAGKLSKALIGRSEADDENSLSSIYIDGGHIEAPSLFVKGVDVVTDTWHTFVDRDGFSWRSQEEKTMLENRDHRVIIKGGTFLTSNGLATETPDYDGVSIAGDGIYFADADIIPDDGYIKISVDNDYDGDGKNDVIVVGGKDTIDGNPVNTSDGNPIDIGVGESTTPTDYPGADNGTNASDLIWGIIDGGEYCSVNNDGVIKGLKAGACTVAAYDPLTGKTVIWKVTIKDTANPDTFDKGTVSAFTAAGAAIGGLTAVFATVRRFFGRR